MPLILFSQKDIDSIPTNKIVSLTIAREIVKDLTRCDSVKVELDMANDLILKSTEKSILKDSIISVYKEKEIRYLDFIKNQDKKYELLETSKKYLEDSLKRDRTKNNINQIFIGLSILGLTYSIIFK
jgi:murein L,D-transpeptidase YafK